VDEGSIEHPYKKRVENLIGKMLLNLLTGYPRRYCEGLTTEVKIAITEGPPIWTIKKVNNECCMKEGGDINSN